MIDDVKLSSVLSEFAFTLATDFSIGSILDHLVHQIVGILPVTAAGVTLIDPAQEPHQVAASDPAALRFERLQSRLEEGPCILAYTTGEAVSSPDLRREERFPRFAPAAVDAGLVAVFTFPMNHGETRLGALDLYRDEPGSLSPAATDAAQTLADVAAAYILNARARQAAVSSSEQMLHMATHDSLTGLPNRTLLLQRIEHAGRRGERTHAPAAVLFIDLDRFKRVNDTYGHEAGDKLLRAVGERLSKVVRPGDTLARVYGDEFVLLCESLNDHNDVDVIADRVRLSFVAPFEIDDVEVTVSASVGVAYAAPGDEISQAMVSQADRAMYDVKRESGVDKVSRAREEEPTRSRSASLGRDLRETLAHEGLDVAYQPIVRCSDGGMTGVEVLLRWTHPHEGPIPALAAGAVAERTGVIGDVGGWVLDRSCRDRVRWQQEHPSASFDLSVNVSTHQLMSPRFTSEVEAALDRTGMQAESLVIEVTETILIEDPERARQVLTEVKRLGVRIALDDFGTGYSSLSYLNRLPIDIVKIDREFIATSGGESKSGAIIAAITDLAHALDLVVVIEGVETPEHHSAAVEVGADFAQGFFFARPVTTLDMDLMLASGGPVEVPLILPLQRRPEGQDVVIA
ncbi:MAG: GGDEF domain-containing protein [Nocardioidaceae bacterium]